MILILAPVPLGRDSVNICPSSNRCLLAVLANTPNGGTIGVLLPIAELTSYRLHRLQPRRIIPGQKVHASILHANGYKPQASLGEGFNILGMELDNEIWETGLFDDTAAHELVTSLGGQKEVPPIHIDRLLFMIRFSKVSSPSTTQSA